MAIIENIENKKYEKKPYKISYSTMTGIGSVVTRPLLWPRSHPWPGNFCMVQVQPKKEKKKKERLFQLCL